MWKLTAQRTPAPLPNWRLTIDHAVAATPLDRYEKAVAMPAAAAAEVAS